jgi:hypothetical protein
MMGRLGLAKHFKKAEKIVGVTNGLKVKVEETSESVKEHMDAIKEKTEERLAPVKEVGMPCYILELPL